MRNTCLVCLLCLVPVLSLGLSAADKSSTGEKLHVDYNIPLWPDGKVPGAVGNWAVDKPYLTVVPPPEGKGNGSAVIICPGGGNTTLFAHQEGMSIAEQMNEWGVTAFVLSYRLGPRYQQDARTMDGRRAVQLLRARAAEFKIDPQHIGMIGFSAGGGLIRPVAAKPLPGDPNATDPIDRVSSRPDFAIIVYGAGRAAPDESLKEFPPAFIIAAASDFTAAGSVQLFSDLRKAGVMAELHIYQDGRHGFGAGYGHPVLADWMGRCESWMKNAGLFKEAR